MWGPKYPVRERMLGVGAAGAGKSTAVLDLAIKIPEANFYVMDAEPGGAWTPDGGRMNPGNELPNIHPRETTEWETFATAAKDFRAQGKPNDWLIVDLASSGYDMVQDFYTEKVKGCRVDDFYAAFATKRAAAKKGMSRNPYEGDTDWQYIKKMYNAVMSDILNFPGHVFGLATVKKPGREEYEHKEVKDLFVHLGVRPDGHWKLPSLFSTILYFKQARRDEWMFTTVRERNSRTGAGTREYVENKQWSDFSKQYLWEIAGWRPGR